MASRAPSLERLELRPAELRVDPRSHPAVGARDHVLSPDALGEADDPLGDELGMLDQVRRVRDDAGGELLAVGQLHGLPEAVLVLVADVGRLDRVDARVRPSASGRRSPRAGCRSRAARASCPSRGDSGRAPRASPRGRGSAPRSASGSSARYVSRSRSGIVIPQCRDPRVVDLEQEAGVDDRPVLLPQGVGERPEQLLLRLVVLVPHVDLGAGRRDDGHEDVGDVDALERRLEVGDVPLDRARACTRSARRRPGGWRSTPRTPGRCRGRGRRASPARTRRSPGNCDVVAAPERRGRRAPCASIPSSRSVTYHCQIDLPNSPSSTMSMPASACRRTTSATAAAQRLFVGALRAAPPPPRAGAGARRRAWSGSWSTPFPLMQLPWRP